MEKIIETIETIGDFVIAIYYFLEWIVAGIENFLIIASSLGIMIVVILALLVLTIVIFRKTISKSHRTHIKKYELNKEITKATERNQIKTKDTVYIWLKYIYSLMDEYKKEYKGKKQSICMVKIYVKIYCEWLIGFFRFTVSGRWIATFFTIYLVFGTYIQQSHQQYTATFSNTLSTFSNTVAQTEAFFYNKYPTQDSINNSEEQPYYYGSAILIEALEFLHKNKRDLDYLYLPRSQLSGINLLGAKLEGGVFSGANLYKSNLSYANLNSANLSRANLQGANFNNANLAFANLSYAALEANLSGATLWNADLSKANLWGADLRDAKLWGTIFSGADLRRVDLSGAELWESDNSSWIASFGEAQLGEAVITSVDFTRVENITKEQIMQTCWLRAGTYRVDGKEIVIEDKDVAPPILPKHIKIDVHSLPKATLGDWEGRVAYCP